MLIRHIKKISKGTAIILLLSFLLQLGAPIMTYAAGPSSPEASGFEPVDTTDMMNPLTGDLAYNLPLIEVPGPEGGYPLSLSYHAGISPSEDASWVGLGWTLNPGAINRNVNGFPDDWYAIGGSKRDYWEGGVTTTTNIGVSVPKIFGFMGGSFGLTTVNDTYRGFGIGGYATMDFGLTKLLGGSLGVGISPYGGMSLLGGIGIGKFGSGAGVNFSVGDQSSIGVSAGVAGAVGISLSSNQGFSVSTIGGTSDLQNGRSGEISTESKSKSLNLIVFSFGSTKTRYWSDETANTNIFGSLYPSTLYYTSIPDNEAYDSYSIIEGDVNWDDNRPDKQKGGAFPSFDSYQVTAQGLGGVMRPYRFTGEVHQQNVIERKSSTERIKTVEYISNTLGDVTPDFRFEGDFSNSYIQDYPDFAHANNELIFYSAPFTPPSADEASWNDGYSDGALAGSRHIAYFTTKSDGTVSGVTSDRTFIQPVVKGLDRKKHIPKALGATHIAGFSITNESGVTYHYNLPAYSYDEEIYQERIDQSQGLAFNRQTKSEGYAYVWYLTAITGPDYVDRGTIGQVDEADYGYWISFEYGKWSDQFSWRNPTTDYRNIEAFKTVAMGKREVYYLNAIKTRTHTALFEKNVRNDVKGASAEIFYKNWSSQNQVSTNYQNAGVYNQNSSQSMRLDHIYLLSNEDASIVSTQTGGAGSFVPTGRTVACTDCELHDNTLDINDINAVGRTVVESKALRVIDFNYDYSLAKGALTSYNINSPSSKTGKLTLKSVGFRGRGGEQFIPPVEFSYDLNSSELKKGSGSVTASSITNANVVYQLGDLIETDETNPVFCGVVTGISQSGSAYTYTMSGSSVTANLGTKNLRNTKNPPFHADKYDVWGMYKADYISNQNENLSRVTSPLSNLSTDVWSLRKIKSSLGAEINISYEGHEYASVAYNRNFSFHINQLAHVSGNSFTLKISTDGNAPSNFFKVGDQLSVVMFKEFLPAGSNPASVGGGGVFVPLGELPPEGDDPLPQPACYVISCRENNNPVVTSIEKSGTTEILHVDFNSNLTSIILDKFFSDYTYPTTRITKGNLSPYALGRYYGGGIRVKSISIDNLSGSKSITEYAYMKDNNQSSGTVIYEPVDVEEDKIPSTVYHNTFQELPTFRNEINPGIADRLRFAKELPPPTVMYEYVTISARTENGNGDKYQSPVKKKIQYEVFDTSKIGIKDVTSRRYGSDEARHYETRNLVLRKFVASIGSIKSIGTFDAQNKLLSLTVNHYLHDGISTQSGDFFAAYDTKLAAFRKQGLLKERFSEVKSVWDGRGFTIKATMTGRENYPCIKVGTTTYDYINNTQADDFISGYDFYSGQVSEQVHVDAYGNRLLSKIVPAYTIYPQMRFKIGNYGGGKHMLIQVAGVYQYKVDANNAIKGLVSANVKQWSNASSVADLSGQIVTQNTAALGNVWREVADYSWLPNLTTADGITPPNQFVNFNFTDPSSSNANWKKTNANLLYNVYSKPMETTDINGQYAAERYGYKHSKVIINGFPAGYYELAFSGAEDETISGTNATYVLKGDGVVTTAAAHTGTSSLRLANTKSGFNYTVPTYNIAPGRSYVASVWVKPVSGTASDVKLYYQINGTTKLTSASSSASNKKSGDWTLVTMEIKGTDVVSGATLKVACRNDHATDVYLDDFRFQPLVSSANAYVYDTKSGELTYVLDNNNLYTRYEYDGMGQLKAVYTEQFGRAPFKVQENQLHYRSN